MFSHSVYGRSCVHEKHVPHTRLGLTTTRSPTASSSPSKSSTRPPRAATVPTFSWPWMMGNGVDEGLAAPVYCET